MRMKAVVPRRLALDPRRLGRAIENALDGAARAAKVDFEVTQQTWSEKSRAAFEIVSRPGERVVQTADRPYVFVTGGTRPHVIRARAAARLAFPANFAAKTTPRRIASGAGGRGGPMVFVREVRHPGSEAREFEVVIAAKWQGRLPVTVQRAIDAEVS